VIPTLKIIFLEIPTGAPSEDTSDLKVLAKYMAHHCVRFNTLCGGIIMGTTGGMNVVVTGDPSSVRKLDPTLQFKIDLVCFSVRNSYVSGFDEIFWTPSHTKGIAAGGQ